MGLVIYKDHVITADVSRDESTGEYNPSVRIAWQDPDGKRDVHSFTVEKRFATLDEATAVAFDEGKAWTDRRITHAGP
jgi:hypothetical protein